MPKVDRRLISNRIYTAKATAAYRSIDEPLKKAIWLYEELDIPKIYAAQAECISVSALQRGLKAHGNNREIGKNGRPLYLNKEQETRLEATILARSASLNSMAPREIMHEVRASL
jgi:hypothetical protein